MASEEPSTSAADGIKPVKRICKSPAVQMASEEPSTSAAAGIEPAKRICKSPTVQMASEEPSTSAAAGIEPVKRICKSPTVQMDSEEPTTSAASGKEPVKRICKAPAVRVSQLRILLRAVESDPSLYNAANSDTITYLNIEKWMKLAEKLNDTPMGAKLSVPNWKYVLRYWSENTKKRMKLPEEQQMRRNPSISPADLAELTKLDKKLYDLIKEEETREVVDVTYVGKLDGYPKPGEDDNANSNHDGVKFVVQLVNVFGSKPDEKPSSEGPKKRTIIMKEDDLETDPTGTIKKYKILFDQNVEEGQSEEQSQEQSQDDGWNQLDKLQLVSRELEHNISTIKSRIHMIKDLWKHRCGDN